MRHRTFQDRAKRDAAYREARQCGYNVRRSSMHGQLCHPQYIEDYEGPEKNDTGFGNVVYKTYFSTLYMLDYPNVIESDGHTHS